jgi:hypothetical protein
MVSEKELNHIMLEIDTLVLEHQYLSLEAKKSDNPKDYNYHLGFAMGAQKALFFLMGYSVCEDCNSAYPSDQLQGIDGRLICAHCAYYGH